MSETVTLYFPDKQVLWTPARGTQDQTDIEDSGGREQRRARLPLGGRRLMTGDLEYLDLPSRAVVGDFVKSLRGCYLPFYIYAWDPQAFTGVSLGVGDGATTLFTLPFKNVTVGTVYDAGAVVSAALAANVWTIRTSAADNNWNSVAFGNGLFVAVSFSGTGNRVMTSPDGITWTIRTSAADNNWNSVTFGNGLFVAVAASGTGNRVMTSPDGITWTSRSAAAANQWSAVTFGSGLFVAVSFSGTGNRVMTSPDGITWTIRTSPADRSWNSIAYGSGQFVAVDVTSANNRVMTSPDGITWTLRKSAADMQWNAVTYGDGLFVAVANSDDGSSRQVMTSSDGITWARQATPPTSSSWVGVAYGRGLFAAVASSGTGNRAMTSPGAGNGQAQIQFTTAPASGHVLTADLTSARERIPVRMQSDKQAETFVRSALILAVRHIDVIEVL